MNTMTRLLVTATAIIAMSVGNRARASSLIYLDEFDDYRVFKPLEDNDQVQKQRKELDGLRDTLMKLDRAGIEKLVGPADKKPAKTYAMPISEERSVVISGTRAASDNRPDSDFISFHPFGDLAAVEVYYSRGENGNKPFAVRFYLKTNDNFKKLSPDTLGADALSERLAWEKQGLKKLAEAIRPKERAK
jgi:hypothetical protein